MDLADQFISANHTGLEAMLGEFSKLQSCEGATLQILAMCNIFPDQRNAIHKSFTLYDNPLTLCQYI